jgi:hypothetical protein
MRAVGSSSDGEAQFFFVKSVLYPTFWEACARNLIQTLGLTLAGAATGLAALATRLLNAPPPAGERTRVKPLVPAVVAISAPPAKQLLPLPCTSARCALLSSLWLR